MRYEIVRYYEHGLRQRGSANADKPARRAAARRQRLRGARYTISWMLIECDQQATVVGRLLTTPDYNGEVKYSRLKQQCK